VTGYAELHCKTNFTFLTGASHPDELATQAAGLGYAALAVADRHSLAGIVRAHTAAKDAGMKLLVGAEIAPVDAPPVVLLATDRAAYGRLCRMLTLGKRRADKGECHLLFADIAAHHEGLLACIPLVQHTSFTLPKAKLKALDADEAAWQGASSSLLRLGSLDSYRELFGDRAYALAELHRGPDDGARLAALAQLAREARLPVAAAGDVHYHIPERQPLGDVLHAIRWGCTVAEAGRRLFVNAERHLKPLDELQSMFAALPGALERTVEAAGRCHFSLDELRYEYPEELAPAGETPSAYLRRLAWAGAHERYPGGVPEKIRQLLEHELTLIEELHYEAYFLTVWDLVRFARSREILCQGRGSAANSAVCYCLGVTSVDPGRLDVLFERFISRERNEAPDIDVDFEHERREEVLQYIYEKYGRDHAGMTAEAIRYCARSAVRDVGKALGLSLDLVDRLAKRLEGYHHEPRLAERCRDVGIDPASVEGRQLVAVVQDLIGFPRHLSQHVGGMVITRTPLCEMTPIENAAMEGRTVIEWNKDDLDELGILKVDCLALGMLTAIRKCFDLVKLHHGRALTLAAVPEGDQRVYDMICQADTMGVFQIESRAQMSMLPRLRPRCYYDLVIEVAIVRPGPIQGNMVHPYLRRRAGEEKVSYPNDAIREVLEKTLGVPLFQEQAMRLAVVAAGFTPGEADQLRRAMAAWRRPGVIAEFQEKLLRGMVANGLSLEFAERVFHQIRGFGEYGFPESHAASFALLVYVSAWLKCHYPAAFAAAVINSQPMGFYAPAQLVRNAKEHGVEVRRIDVNDSDWDCTLEVEEEVSNSPASRKRERPEETAAREKTVLADATSIPPGANASGSQMIRLGLRLVSGLSEAHAEAVVRARKRGPFRSTEDLARRAHLPRKAMTALSEADALGSLGINRRQALWESLGQDPKARELPLLAALAPEEDELVALPELSAAAEVAQDYESTGLTLRAHPISFVREELNQIGIARAEQLATLPADGPVIVAGLVLVRQRPSTAKGITFVTLEDETGVANLVVHQNTWDRYYQAARTAAALIAHGKLQREGIVIHVVVTRLEDLSRRLRIGSQSRDFR
jgi:error-prone DNA polymerase